MAIKEENGLKSKVALMTIFAFYCNAGELFVKSVHHFV